MTNFEWMNIDWYTCTSKYSFLISSFQMHSSSLAYSVNMFIRVSFCRCSDESECIHDWYLTLNEPHCTDSSSGRPDNGTKCYYCCASMDPTQPHFCSDNPETNYITFPVTTSRNIVDCCLTLLLYF